MSFSSQVKDEISVSKKEPLHCMLAELSAILSLCGTIEYEEDIKALRIQTENLFVARKYFTLIRKTFKIVCDVSVRRNMRSMGSYIYVVRLAKPDACRKILLAAGLLDRDDHIPDEQSLINSPILKSRCCQRAYLRGAFLSSGSISDPNNAYHLEFTCQNEDKAHQLNTILAMFDAEGKVIRRKRYYIVYIKDGSRISDILNIVGAYKALMKFENIRILKDVRNNVNRQVNCETANIKKTVKAAEKQREDIMLVMKAERFNTLPDTLKEIAKVRIDNPEASLIELGQMLSEPIGKSGVNHRLKRLSEIADSLRAL